MYRLVIKLALGVALAGVLAPWESVVGASPKAEDALKLAPIQKGVDYDRPAPNEAAKCKIYAKKVDGQVGWVVEDANGQVLRRFVDTNGDNIVDQWSYYKDGIEVYRDIDSNFNGKADQYRWFNTAGSRWGLDKNENGTIDTWKAISAEEVSAEVIAALANQDAERFLRLALTPAEARDLGLGEEKLKQLQAKLEKLRPECARLLSEQKVVTSGTRWLQFNAGMPGVVPAGVDGSTADVTVYENVLAIVETGGKHGEVQIGTLVRVGDTWRLIDVPHPVAEGRSDPTPLAFFFRPAAAAQPKAAGGGPADTMQDALTRLQKLDADATALTTPEQRADYNARRAELIEKIADNAKGNEERDMWLMQLADFVGAAVQQGTYPDGVKRLETLYERLRKDESLKDVAAHVRFRQLTVDYDHRMQAPGADFAKLQNERRSALEQYVSEYPKAADAAEAMLQLAIDREFAAQEDDAKKWYTRILEEFADSPPARKATGARARLELVGKPIRFQGKSTTGEAIDVSRYRGNVVLIHFWATWSGPSKAEMPVLKDLLGKYGQSGFKVVAVNVNSRAQDLAMYLSENRLPWPQIFEEGGLESRPANQLGIITVPTMILIDQNGKVVNRSLRVADLESELKKLLR